MKRKRRDLTGKQPTKNGEESGRCKTSGRFTKGNHYSKGRPVGSRNSASISVENLFLDEAEQLTRRCIELALQDQPSLPALKLAIERICPVRKDSPINVDLPAITDISSASEFTSALLEKVTVGELTPSQAELLSRIAEKATRAQQLVEIEMKLEELTVQLQGQGDSA